MRPDDFSSGIFYFTNLFIVWGNHKNVKQKRKNNGYNLPLEGKGDHTRGG